MMGGVRRNGRMWARKAAGGCDFLLGWVRVEQGNHADEIGQSKKRTD